ncbi:Uncharacterised protein [Mycobacteroides abscessus subsp. massiliense]|nr:Uncharacterised protein [Mycobacteroides abscessus subsp. massiliense]
MQLISYYQKHMVKLLTKLALNQLINLKLM